MGSRWFRVFQWVVGIAILAAAVRSLLRNWDELQGQPVQLVLSPGWIALSAGVIWLMYALLIVAWRLLLRGWGQRLDGWTAARIWTVSSLGKYLPGKVWALAGMAVMAQRAGIAPWAAAGSAVVLQVLAIGCGAAVVGLTGMGALEAARPGARVALVALAFAAAAGVALLLWPPMLRRVLRVAAPGADAAPLPAAGGIVWGIGTNLLAWTGYGVALWLLARGVLPGVRLDLALSIAVFTVSYLAGFLALLAPGGIGVREGVFILMLQGPLGIRAATALALASRLLLTLTEVGAAAPFLAFPREHPRVAT